MPRCTTVLTISVRRLRGRRNHKLMHLVAVYSSLISANAFVSTLGGGHFLCKQIDSSRRMAERQIDIARRLGDTALMLRCSVHLVYNDIQAGDFESAYVRVQDLREAAVEREVRGPHPAVRRRPSDVTRCVLAVCARSGSRTRSC